MFAILAVRKIICVFFIAAIGWGHGGRVPPLFLPVGIHYACPSHFFKFRFCIWIGFKNKSDVCHVLCEELFMLDGRSHIVKLMSKQRLVWYH